MSAATPTPVQPNPLGGESYRLILPNTAAAPRIARDFLTSLLHLSRHPGLVDDARLCVTELVTNAHCHTRTPLIGVHVAVNRKRVTVAVSDDGGPVREAFGMLGTATATATATAGSEQEHGRGLALVESLALAWGTGSGGERHPGRTVVWFTLGRPGVTT
ncbi:ATP-binding protein [Streptomyces cyaneofuscatus]|uniref:ATP-binding protein n=1 Tax=Streptomyces cyaneofuscatus TaxID=66883 RepID=UPI0037D81945